MIDAGALDECGTYLNTRLRSHGGAVELSAAADGSVEVRFGGMCCGCPYKALTFEGTVRPTLERVPGVTAVHAPGTRVSGEASTRLQRYIDDVAIYGVRYDRHRNARSSLRAVRG